MSVLVDVASGEHLSRTTNLPSSLRGVTLCGWVRSTSSPARWHCMLDISANTGAYMYLEAQNNSYSYEFWTADNVGGSAGVTLHTATQNAWYFYAMTSNASTGATTCYVRGLSSTSFTKVSGTYAMAAIAPTRMFLGNSVWTDEGFYGDISTVKLYAAELTEAELWLESENRVPIRTVNLNGWYPILAGERTRDYSGNGYNLTETGTPTDDIDPPITWAGRRLSYYVAAGGSPVTLTPYSLGGWGSIFYKPDVAVLPASSVSTEGGIQGRGGQPVATLVGVKSIHGESSVTRLPSSIITLPARMIHTEAGVAQPVLVTGYFANPKIVGGDSGASSLILSYGLTALKPVSGSSGVIQTVLSAIHSSQPVLSESGVVQTSTSITLLPVRIQGGWGGIAQSSLLMGYAVYPTPMGSESGVLTNKLLVSLQADKRFGGDSGVSSAGLTVGLLLSPNILGANAGTVPAMLTASLLPAKAIDASASVLRGQLEAILSTSSVPVFTGISSSIIVNKLITQILGAQGGVQTATAANILLTIPYSLGGTAGVTTVRVTLQIIGVAQMGASAGVLPARAFAQSLDAQPHYALIGIITNLDPLGQDYLIEGKTFNPLKPTGGD